MHTGFYRLTALSLDLPEMYEPLQVMIHPSSVNSQLAVPEPQRGQGHPCHIVLYDEVTRGESQLYVCQCTAASPHALLMVAAHLGVSQEEDGDEEDEDNQPGAHAVVKDLCVPDAACGIAKGQR